MPTEVISHETYSGILPHDSPIADSSRLMFTLRSGAPVKAGYDTRSPGVDIDEEGWPHETFPASERSPIWSPRPMKPEQNGMIGKEKGSPLEPGERLRLR